MNKKRLFAFVLLVVMIVTLPACAKNEQAALATVGPTAATKSDYPTRPVDIICSMSAGGNTDFNARLNAVYLGKHLGQSVVVTNNTGNGGADASNLVKGADADGYTMLFTSSVINSNKASGVTNFDLSEFDTICIAGIAASEVLCVASKAPYNTVKELFDYTQQNPFKVSWAANVGATSHFAGIIANNVYGSKLNLVSTGSTTERVAALVGGNVDCICVPYNAVKDYVEKGDVKLLCMMASKRQPYLPDLQTGIEAGYPDFFYDSVYYLAAPKGTPKEIKDLIGSTLAEVRATDEDGYKAKIYDTYKESVYYLQGDEADAYATKELAHYMSYSKYYKK